jgi:hypothetical protein
MKVRLNTQHIVERLAQRAETLEMGETPQAFAERCRAAIENNAPDDWRFTMHPGAAFFLTYVGSGTQIKLLGRSYRVTQHSESIWKTLEALANEVSHAKNRNFAWRTDISTRLRRCADDYRHDLSDPDAEICHELKTVYRPEWGLGEEEDWHPNNLDDYPHTGLLCSSDTSRNLAKRPNALLIPDDKGSLDLWVRQGNAYVKMTEGANSLESYCLFCRLEKSGLVSSQGALWRFDAKGMAERVSEAICASQPEFVAQRPPTGFRSWNYWALPTLIDAKLLDLKERQENAYLWTFNQEPRLVTLIEAMYQIAFGKRPPKWC